MEKLLRVGKFFRLIDEQNNLSITNIMVMIAAYKLMSAPVIGFQDVAVGAVALMGYMHKRQVKDKK